jgi:murein L,D-transpeptidase YcbB/YkuD
MTRGHSPARHAGGRTFLVAAALLAYVLSASSAAAQALDEAIRTLVEDLAASGDVAVDGAPIASRHLILKLYEARAFEPTWTSVAQIDSLLEVIDESQREGLDPRDYHVERVRAAREAFGRLESLPPEERAGLDLLLTDSVIRLGYQLRFGKVDAVALNPHWNMTRDLVSEDAAATIQAAINSASMHEFAEKVIPRVFLYQRFKVALAEYRGIAANGGWPTIETGATLKPGMTDARVSVLARRLAITRDLDSSIERSNEDLYDATLVQAVQHFQRRHGLAADGAVGAATLAALNVPVEQRIDQLRANLERARWVFYDPESEFLVVNIAGFRLYLVRRGEVVWTTRVQVGQPYRRTPVFTSTVRYLVLNPTWTVPPGILSRDILPRVRQDPGYLATRNIELIDDAGAIVDPATVDWSSRGVPYRFVQPAGATNALGRVKFMFPNDYSVYLHDTPSRDLFDRESRAFSSGCIRVEEPLELAQRLLGSGWDRRRIEAAIESGETRTVFLEKPMPVMLLYWTAEVDEPGVVSFFPDVYGLDDAIMRALEAPFRASDVL